MWFEIWKNRKLIKRGDEILNEPSWENAPMTVPSTVVTVPITYAEFLNGREEFKLFMDDKCFWGIVVKCPRNKVDETIDVHLEHVVQEWTYRQISINNAIKEQNLNIVFKGTKTDTVQGVTVSANDFTILVEEIGAFSSDDYIRRSGADAWNEHGGEETITVDSSKVESKEGSYDVVFTSGEASVTVKATVKEEAVEKEEDGYKMTASNFSLTTDETLTDAQMIERANVTIEPELEIKVDASSLKYVQGTYTIKFYANYTPEGEEEEKEISVSVTAIVEGQGSGDAAVVDDLMDIYTDTNFAYPGWKLNFSKKAQEQTIDYVYSRQNKLEALTKTMELTEDLYWRVRFVNAKEIDISEFGEKKPYIISTKPTGPNNISIVEDPEVEYDFENVINVATVYSQKSDSGMSSMTMREIYNDPDLQEDGFPVVILRNNVNNERDYRDYTYQYPKLAPNNELEYAVVDEESVALEAGEIIEGTFAFDDLSPFTPDDEGGETKEITDEDRIEAAKTAYKATIRKLKDSRRRLIITVPVEFVPVNVNVCDKVRFIYDNMLWIYEQCSPYQKHILSLDDWYYLTKIDYEAQSGGVDTVTLEKYLVTDRDIKVE